MVIKEINIPRAKNGYFRLRIIIIMMMIIIIIN